MTLFFLLLTVFLPAFAQGDSTIFTDSNLAAVLRLDGDGSFASATYSASGGEIVTIRAESAGDNALDLVLELLAPDAHSVAYVDSRGVGSAEIVRIALQAAGDYAIRVNTFNGEGMGEVNVTLTVQPPLAATPDTGTLRIPLGANETAVVALDGFDADAVWDIIASDPRGLLDPYLMLTDASGTPLAVNDDHATAAPSLNRFDAQIRAAIPAGAQLRITEFLGRAGFIDLMINP